MTSDTILIVEDNLLVAEDLRVKLNKLGFQVVGVAKNGELAIQKAHENHPDLILMDIQLGKGINGIDAAEHIRKDQDVPIIFLTAYTDDETLHRAKQVVPYGYIVKPFDSKKLKTTIEVALHKRSADKIILQSKQWFETTLQSIGDGVITTDLTGRVIFMNPVAETLTGWTSSQAKGQPLDQIFNVIDEENRQKQRSLVDRVIGHDGVTGITNNAILLTKEGTELNIAKSGSPIRNDQGDIIGIVIIFRDKTSERLSQLALEKSVNDFRLFFDSNPSATFVWECVESDFRLVQVNHSALKMTDGNASKFKGLLASQIYHDLPGMIEKFTECMSSGSPLRFVEHYQNRYDRSFDWIDFTLAPILPNRLILYADNITEQKEAELALQKEQEKSKQYLDVAEVMLLALDTSGCITLINPKGCQILGYKEEELLGRNWYEHFIPQEHYDEVKSVITNLHKGNIEQYGRYENPVVTKDGVIRIIEWHNSTMLDDSGKVSGIFSSGRDITEEKTIQKVLQENEEKYRILFKSSSDAIFLVDADTMEILDANDRAVDLYGYSHDELLSMIMQQISAEPVMTEATVKKAEDTIVPLRYHRKKDQTVFPVEITANFLPLAGKRINISTIRDVSEIKEYERRLNQARKVESIGNLAGGIAHDFNNILSSIIGFTQLAMEDAAQGSELEDELQEVLNAGKRAKELVQQILTFARQSDEKRAPLNIGVLTKETLKFIRSTIPTTIDIQTDISSSSSILGSQSQIQQIFMNLCTNASHAMDTNGGVLKIKIKDFINDKDGLPIIKELSPGEYVEISVSDTGHGISDDKISSIFDPYFTTKDVGKGTGIGLAVVHGIVESYNGKIIVHSRVGQGTTFRVFLPKTGKVVQAQLGDSVEAPKGSERILLIDDEPSVAKLGDRLLSQLGYSVTAHTSSKTALDIFQRAPESFDLVITDVTMPEISGAKLMTEILKIRPRLPVILCTGYSRTLTEKEAYALGAKALLYKPYVKDEFARIIRDVLALSSR